MIIWSDEILKEIEKLGRSVPVFAKIGLSIFRIIGIEDSVSIGWYEIRIGLDYEDILPTIASSYLMTHLPKGEMVMLQEGGHLGKSYPINSILTADGKKMILKCENPDSEYWDELEKWKIREDNLKIGITNFMRDELEKRKQ